MSTTIVLLELKGFLEKEEKDWDINAVSKNI